jgi:hypothetical protein
MEQKGTKLVGSTTFRKLFRSSLGPLDIIACVLKGNQAATYIMGMAMIDDSANPGFKKRYTNATIVSDENVGTGDGSTTTFDLANANVIADTLHAYDSDGDELAHALSVGTGDGSVDQIVLEVAPASGAIKVNYRTGVTTGACILMNDAATVVGGGNLTMDGARDGSVDSTLVVDSADADVDDAFKSALPKVMFD